MPQDSLLRSTWPKDSLGVWVHSTAGFTRPQGSLDRRVHSTAGFTRPQDSWDRKAHSTTGLIGPQAHTTAGFTRPRDSLDRRAHSTAGDGSLPVDLSGGKTSPSHRSPILDPEQCITAGVRHLGNSVKQTAVHVDAWHLWRASSLQPFPGDGPRPHAPYWEWLKKKNFFL